jgi:two-component system, chemotaxis family, CheB/CheR fusion protein
LLDVSRITRGRLELRTHRTDLMIAVDMALETTRPLVERKRHRLWVEVTGGPLVVDGDVTRLAQVLATLIDNSALYSDPESPIKVTLTRDSMNAVLTVSDRGIGIAPELLPWVFDMFARPSPPCIGARSGLGIGLTLVKRLVELHGGSIEAHSEGLNRGSAFTVRLPLAADATDTAVPVDSSRPVYVES